MPCIKRRKSIQKKILCIRKCYNGGGQRAFKEESKGRLKERFWKSLGVSERGTRSSQGRCKKSQGRFKVSREVLWEFQRVTGTY